MKKNIEKKIIIGILIFAFILRIWGINWGLPLFLHLDENTIGGTVIKMMKNNDLNPHYFRYPGLYFYFIYFIASIFGLIAKIDFSNTANMAALYLLGRFSTALISTAAVYLTYLLGKKFFSSKIGILAAAVFSVMFLPVYLSHFMVTDMPALFFLLIALIFSFQVYQRGRFGDYFLAGLFSGLLIGTKFNFFVFAPLVFAHFFPDKRLKKQPFSQLIMALVIAALAFLITNFYLLSDWKNYIDGFWSQLALQKGEEVLMMSDKDGIPAWQWYWQYWLYSGIGFNISISSLLGIIIALLNKKKEKRKFLLFVLFPLFYLLFISKSYHRGDRYSLPLMPFLAVFSALFLKKGIDFLKKTVHRPKTAMTVSLLFLLLFLGPAAYQGFALDYLISQKDTRLLAGEWIEKNYPPDQLILAMANATETGWYLQTKNFTRVVNLYHLKMEEIFLYPGELFLINSSDYHFAKNYQSVLEYQKFWENYQLIKSEGELVREFSYPLFKGEFFSPAFLEHSSAVNAYHHPTTEIYRIPYLPEFYQEEINFEYQPQKMISNLTLKEESGKEYLWADGQAPRLVIGPGLFFPKGSYFLEYQIDDLNCLDPQAELLLAAAALGRKLIFAQENYSCGQIKENQKFVLEFNLEKANGLELIFGGGRGVSFSVRGAILRGKLAKP